VRKSCLRLLTSTSTACKAVIIDIDRARPFIRKVSSTSLRPAKRPTARFARASNFRSRRQVLGADIAVKRDEPKRVLSVCKDERASWPDALQRRRTGSVQRPLACRCRRRIVGLADVRHLTAMQLRRAALPSFTIRRSRTSASATSEPGLTTRSGRRAFCKAAIRNQDGLGSKTAGI
jgi:hypothetical protein